MEKNFLKNNILFVNSNYKSVVIYKCLNKNILADFWPEELENPKYIGAENYFRITDKNELIN
jgi:hypothetical protein